MPDNLWTTDGGVYFGYQVAPPEDGDEPLSGDWRVSGREHRYTGDRHLVTVGPNGSGKTTAINVISGLYAPDGGEVTLDGASIGGVASHRLVHRGINRTFQIPKPFLSLTVRENVEVALAYGRAAVMPPTMRELLDEYNLADLADRPAADLNNAQQKMLDLVRALATRPRLLLLDELAAGLNPAELDWIA